MIAITRFRPSSIGEQTTPSPFIRLEQARDLRRKLRTSHGIFVKVEFHATEFVSGRGRICEGE